MKLLIVYLAEQLLIAIKMPANLGLISKWLICVEKKIDQCSSFAKAYTSRANLKSTVNSAVQADADRQQENSQNSIASRVRHNSQTNRRSKLTDAVENLSRYCDTTFISGDEPIGDHRKEK